MRNLLVILIIAISICSIISCSKNRTNTDNIDEYHFPIKPGTEEWKSFTSHDEMLQACQIPEDILKGMSTVGLIETVLNYPLSKDIIAYNTPQGGINSQIKQFNGLSELLKRTDAKEKLLDKYQEINSLDGENSFKLSYLICILSQDDIISHLSENELSILLKEGNNKLSKKQESNEPISSNIKYTVWLMGKAMRQKNFTPFVEKIKEDKILQQFLDDGFIADDEIIEEIELYVGKCLSAK